MTPERKLWLERLEVRGRSPATMRNYEQALIKAAVFHDCSPLGMSTGQIEQFLLHELRVEKRAPSTVNLHIAAFRSFYELVAPDSRVMEPISKVKGVQRLPVVLTTDEVREMICRTANLKHRAILEVLYCSGIRLRECMDLALCDVSRKEMLVHVRNGKGGKERYTLLAESAAQTLVDYYRKYFPREWLFEGRDHAQIAPRTIAKLVDVAARRAGIDKEVSPHVLRHTFATHLLEQNVALPVIQKLLGHGSIRTTMIYLHVSNVTLRTVVNPLDLMRQAQARRAA